MVDQLLTTKLYVSQAHPNLVPRPRLSEWLEEGIRRKLTLISAPAGFGKTTLLSEWRMSHPGSEYSVGWVSLEEADNDPVRFLSYLIAALQTIEADIGEVALLSLRSPQPPPVESVLTALINEIIAIPDDFALVLDDYHVIEAQPIHNAIIFLLEHLPPQMHLVIASRTEPPLPLSRLRAGGQITELRAADLRFTSEEAIAFLADVMGLDLSAEDVAVLDARTEGWIAGLQLAALSMQRQEDVTGFLAAFTGDDRYIMDYLVEEVLHRQPERTQTFLLRTSMLERLSGPLCDATTGFGDGQQMLERLEQANLFLIALDNRRRWYRYHHLFADVLRQRLHRTQPEGVPELHRRAAAWLERNGLVAESVGHALIGEDFELAARLVERHAEAMWLRGEVATLEGWLQALPERVVSSRPRLCIVHAWMLFLTGRLDGVEPRLHEAEQALRDSGPEIGDSASAEPSEVQNELLGMVATIRASLASIRDDAALAIALSREALEGLPEQSAHWRSQSNISLGIALDSSGDVAGAIQAFDNAAVISQHAGNTFQAIIALWSLAVRQIMRGHLRQAEWTYRRALRFARERGEERLPAAALAHIGLGDLLRERNDLQTAERHMREGLELGMQGGNFGTRIGSHMGLARVLQAQGAVDAALDALRPAEELARQSNTLPLYVVWLAATRARLWLAQGNLADAARWAEEYGPGADQDLARLWHPRAQPDVVYAGAGVYRPGQHRSPASATNAGAHAAHGGVGGANGGRDRGADAASAGARSARRHRSGDRRLATGAGARRAGGLCAPVR